MNQTTRPLFRTIFLTLLLSAFSAVAIAQEQDQGPQTVSGKLRTLQERVKKLERQVSDLQVLFGTFETLMSQQGQGPLSGQFGAQGPRSPLGTVSGGRVPNDIADRLDALETQIQALSAANGAPTRMVPRAAPRQENSYGTDGFGGRGQAPSPDLGGFSAQVQRNNVPANVDMQPLGPPGIDGRNVPDIPLTPLPSNQKRQRKIAAVAPSGPKKLYEEAYGELLKRNYESAQQKFSQFLSRHPKDSLAGNAQFWLAESYYVRGDYRKAAQNFLKGYKTYQGGAKAADSLLKLAMSLNQLGKKDAACTTFLELGTKFPNAPRHVRQRAEAEQRNAGC